MTAMKGSLAAALVATAWMSQAGAQLLITEFAADNNSGLRDAGGATQDWIEIHNPTGSAVNLSGWALTDDPGDLNKWQFPPLTLPAGGYLVVFASDLDRTEPEAELHTNFKLSASGEYLALVGPEGVASAYEPAFPRQIPDVSYGLARDASGVYTASARYFSVPTPGEPNGTGTADQGPLLTSPAHSPERPASGESVTVTVRVTPLQLPVQSVTLHWIVMYPSASNPEKELVMRDDGSEGDAVAGDGVYTAVIPGTVTVDGVETITFGAGRLIRWRFTATDSAGNPSSWPLYPDPQRSARYLGTVAQDPPEAFRPDHPEGLPVWYWFAQNIGAANTDAGTRGAVYFRGRLYDNIFIRRRGGYTSTGSKKFDFNPGEDCYIDDVVGSVKEANLNLSDSDSTLIRPPLAFEVFRNAGLPASAAFPVLMRSAGATTSPGSTTATNTIAYYAEQVDERFLQRWGLDTGGALYKFVQRSSIDPVFSTTTDGVEKKTRKDENRADLQAVVAALTRRNTEEQRLERQVFMFDNFNLAALSNYFACRALIQDTDDIRKNFYFYRDTRGSGEWQLFPWDKDWTFGITGDGGTYTSHPFLGDRIHAKDGGRQWNLLMEAFFNDSRTQAMYLRRLRSVIDAQLQPPGTPLEERILEARADAWFELLKPYKPGQSAAPIKSFLNQRRTQLYNTYGPDATNPANRLVPPAQDPDVTIGFGTVDANPAGGNQKQEYVELLNPNEVAVDLSGWQVTGGIDHTFEPGTVILAKGSDGDPSAPGRLYLANDAAAFRARETGPRGGQGLHVQGGWKGSLSARGESLTLLDDRGRVVATIDTPSNPTPAQQWLRITKLMYAPAPGGDYSAGDYEYVELRNTGSAPLDISGVTFDRGISFTFPPGSVLSPGQRILLVKNPEAFASRYGAGLPVAGTYEGSLSNEGERIRLLDASGEEVLDFSWDPAWQPETLRGGAALVIVDDSAEWRRWSESTAWRASVLPNGNPGGPDGAEPEPPGPFRIVAFEAAGDSQFRIAWSSVGGARYRFDTSSAPDTGNWQELQEGSGPKEVTGTAGTTEAVVTLPPGDGPVFLRVRQLP